MALFPGLYLTAALASACASGPHTGEAHACELPSADGRWIQTALDGWERVSTEILELDPSPLPWMVLFDRSCAWHLAADGSRLPEATAARTRLTFAGEPVRVLAARHDSAVWLPSGSTIPIEGVAFASIYERAPGARVPFFVLALPGVWREKFPEDPDLESTMLGVFSHEMVHTRQLVYAARRAEAIEDHYALPEDVSDDIIEEHFEEVPGFREAHEAETDLFYRATSVRDPARRRALVAAALELVRTRQTNYFAGPDAVYRPLEEMFLNMEGVAVWAAYRLSRADPAFDIGIDDPAEDRARNTWSQDEGLALFLLIDELVPDWQERALGVELASPFALLEEAVGAHAASVERR